MMSSYACPLFCICLSPIRIICYLSMKHFTSCASPAVLHLLCVESYPLDISIYIHKTNFKRIRIC